MDKRKLAITTAIVAIVVGLLVTTAYMVMHSPTYTMYKIKKSLKNHDWETFSAYVDVNAVFTSFVSQSKDDANPIGSGLVEAMAGALRETAIAKMKNEVENPANDTGDIGIIGAFSQPDSVRPKIEIVKNGKIASARIYGAHFPLNVPAFMEVRMRSEGWKYVVIGVEKRNIDYRSGLVERALKKFYTIPAQKRLRESVSIEITKKYKGCSNSFFGTCMSDLIMVERVVENKAGRDISRCEYKICTSSADDDDGCHHVSDEIIPANERKTFGRSVGWNYNQFIPSHREFMNEPMQNLKIQVEKVVFADGDSIEVNDMAWLDSYESHPSLSELAKFSKENGVEGADSIEAWSQIKL